MDRGTPVGTWRAEVEPGLADHIAPAFEQEIDEYKLPALRQSGAKLHPDPEIVLFARSGFTKGLREAAAGNDRLHLVGLDDLVPAGASDG